MTAIPQLTQEKELDVDTLAPVGASYQKNHSLLEKDVAFELRQAPPEPVDGGGKLCELARHTVV